MSIRDSYERFSRQQIAQWAYSHGCDSDDYEEQINFLINDSEKLYSSAHAVAVARWFAATGAAKDAAFEEVRYHIRLRQEKLAGLRRRRKQRLIKPLASPVKM